MDSAGPFVMLYLRPGLSLSRGFCLFLCRWPCRFFGSFLLEQSQGIRSVERVLADRLLTRGTQSDVYASIARQDDRAHVLENPLPLFGSQLGILLHRISHLGIGQVLLFAKRLGFDVCGGNAVFDQEASGALDAPFGERLIVFHGGAWVGMAFENQVGIRLDLQIFPEIASQRKEAFAAGWRAGRHRVSAQEAGPSESKCCARQVWFRVAGPQAKPWAGSPP